MFLSRHATLRAELQALFKQQLRAKRELERNASTPLRKQATMGSFRVPRPGGSQNRTGGSHRLVLEKPPTPASASASASASSTAAGSSVSSSASAHGGSSTSFSPLAGSALAAPPGIAARQDYLKVIRPFFESVSPLLALTLLEGRTELWNIDDVHRSSGNLGGPNSAASHALAIDHLFCWATFRGNLELARCLWRRSKRPVHMALLGCFLCRHMEAAVYLEKQALVEAAEEMQR